MKDWQLNKTNLVCGFVALLGIAQFGYGLVRAVRCYPGGYLLSEHFLSDLGRTVTSNGQINTVSASIFNQSVIVLGCSLIPFFLAMPEVLETGRWLVRLSGVLSALGLVGIGLTPYNSHLAAHLVALCLWLVPMLVSIVVFSVSAELGGRLRTLVFVGMAGVVFAFCGYAFVESHYGHVVFQKILVVLAVLWFCLVFACVSVSTIQSMSSRKLVAERQARAYLKVIQRRPRRPQ